MARRLLSTFLVDEAGNRIGGSGTELRIYTDAALTTLATVYARDQGATTQTQPLKGNAGKQTTLAAAIAIGASTISVNDVTGWQTGDLCAVYDGTNTRYAVITAIDAGLKRFTVEVVTVAAGTFDVGFAVAGTLVGNADMLGHTWGYVDDAQDYYMQVKDVGSARVLPPVILPIRIPTTTIEGFDEGLSVAARGKIDIRGNGIALTDDAANSRLVVTHADLGTHGGTITDAQHGARSVANAHQYSQIGGTHGTSAHDSTIPTSDEVIKWALIG